MPASSNSSTHHPLNLAFHPACSWPKDADEWKRLLAKAAPWLAGAAIAVAAAYGYKNRVRGAQDLQGCLDADSNLRPFIGMLLLCLNLFREQPAVTTSRHAATSGPSLRPRVHPAPAPYLPHVQDEAGQRIDSARRKADQAAKDAGESAKLGWFGLKVSAGNQEYTMYTGDSALAAHLPVPLLP